MTTCLLCLRPIRRRWWHWFLVPLRVHVGSEAKDCCAWLDAHGRRVRTP